MKQKTPGFVVLETGEVFRGEWLGGSPRAGELVFNTNHTGYEEIATDPSYFSQIMVMTAPQQGNYGSRREWESDHIHIQGFVALELQNSHRDRAWVERLATAGVPILQGVDTRRLVFKIRSVGTPWSALVQAGHEDEALAVARNLIAKQKNIDSDWVHLVSRKKPNVITGHLGQGPRVAVIDFGTKENIVRELASRSKEVLVLPSRVSPGEIRDWNPDGIVLTNGPGDPASVKQAVETVRELLGWKPIFGICMGHQILALALGGKTYKMPFGHRGGNHPVKDYILNEIYMTSQNHGYAVAKDSLRENVKVTHVNLYDGTVEGIACPSLKCFSVQFHPENHPGPRDATGLFNYFQDQLL